MVLPSCGGMSEPRDGPYCHGNFKRKGKQEVQEISSGLPHPSSERGATGFHFSNPIFFVYHGELPPSPYCNRRPNSIKLPPP